MSDPIGLPLARVDGVAKVTGEAVYTADHTLPGLVHAVMVESAIARGHIVAFELDAAAAVPGVLGILTHENAPRLKTPPGKGPWSFTGSHLTLQDDRVRFDRQPVAVVVAETLHAAMHAAKLVKVHYREETPRISVEAEEPRAFRPEEFLGQPVDKGHGDPGEGWKRAEVTVDCVYRTPVEHHNPIELHGTIARWDGDRLEVYDATQWVGGVRDRLAGMFDLARENVRVICRFLGGGFGSKGSPWPHVPLAVMAAKHVGRPVKLVATRAQVFGVVGFRSSTRQHVRLGATREGRLVAYEHESLSQTSDFADYVEPVGRSIDILYDCPNVAVRQRLVRLDVNTPTFMRAPGDATGLFALESAMDELAEALGMDPLALRLLNYAEREPGRGRPWSSKSLRECYGRAAARFGWEGRPPKPRSLRDGRHLVGWGMATATLHTMASPASARVRLYADGSALVETASHDLGTGAYTILTQIAAEALGMPPERVEVALGDTDLPAAPLSAGSQTTASVGPVVAAAARSAREHLARLAFGQPDSPLYGYAPDELDARDGRLYVRGQRARGETFQEILARSGRTEVVGNFAHEPVDEDEAAEARRSFGCHFVEVRVDEELGEVRVSRYVGAFAAGRIINERTARSQLVGAVVGGIGMALMEQALRDPRRARTMNADLASYLVPTCADVPELEVLLVEEEDARVNALGVKGLGELGIIGVAGAIANAVYHATGRRLRELPLTPDKLLS